MCQPLLLQKATEYELALPFRPRSSNTLTSALSSRSGKRFRNAATTSGVARVMQAQLQRFPTHEHFSLASSACAPNTLRSESAAIPARSRSCPQHGICTNRKCARVLIDDTSCQELDSGKFAFLSRIHETEGGATHTTMRRFQRLGVQVDQVLIDQQSALQKLQSGEVAALVRVVGKPVDFHQDPTEFRSSPRPDSVHENVCRLLHGGEL
jgi:hypothetical protein